ncbi:L-ascorbate peroxidase 3 [Senna tora]|uniref:L-ascorbate peroxidase 3 n=1 Tax=Senna tora TaxID=362788 RepID=A0A834TVI9_9FABA|nr:L-ascorbate peroxidase 3 [Senna tora]
MSGQVVIDNEYRKQIQKARCQLRALILNDIDKASLMLRLALHYAGTYDPNDNIKGSTPNGSMKNEKELNQGLAEAVNLFDEVKKECPKITRADLYQLAGIVAVEITGGPSIEFNAGRQDSMKSPEEEWLASDDIEDASKLRNINKRMGLSDGDFVALYGGLKRLSKEMTADDKGKTAPLKFDNLYFKQLLKTNALTLKGVEKALMDDIEFHKIVESYAKEEEAFLSNYVGAHKKISERGGVPTASSLTSREGRGSATTGGAKSVHAAAASNSSSSWNRGKLAQGAIGVAVATTVVILSYLFTKRSK